jgi:large subunit ribosomal protein L9
MKVIFIQDVARVGRKGEVKEVANGFATNVLIPKKQAVIATGEAIRKIEVEKQNKEAKKELDKNLFLKAVNTLWEEISSSSNGLLEIEGHKSDKHGNLFSQIKEEDIVKAIFEKIKISFNPSQIDLGKSPIKKLGEYEIELKDPTSHKASSGHSKENKRKIKIFVK